MSRAKRIRRALARHPNAVCPDCEQELYWWPDGRRYVDMAGNSMCPAKNDFWLTRGRTPGHTIPGRRRRYTGGPSY